MKHFILAAVVLTLAVTAIMISKGKPTAIINGKVHWVGDALSNGFSITAIDGGAGTVEVGDALGRSAVLTLKSRRSE